MAVPNQAEKNILRQLIKSSDMSPVICLAQNNPAHADDDVVLADLVEADFDGYARLDLTAQDVSSLATNGDGEAELLTATLTYTAGAGIAAAQTIYGAWIQFTDYTTADALMFWFRFADPFTFAVAGQFMEKTIDFKLRQRVP